MTPWHNLATTLIQAAGEGPATLTLGIILLDNLAPQDLEALALVMLRKLDPEALSRVDYFASLLTPTAEEETVDPTEDPEPDDDEPAESNARAHLEVLEGGKTMTTAEIADATGLKVETVRKRMAKAKAAGQVRRLETSGVNRWTLVA